MAVERNVVMTFKVSSYEKSLIEKYAKREDCSVSDCIRGAVFIDMLMSGYGEGIKYVGSVVKGGLSEALRSKMQSLLLAKSEA